MFEHLSHFQNHVIGIVAQKLPDPVIELCFWKVSGSRIKCDVVLGWTKRFVSWYMNLNALNFICRLRKGKSNVI